MMTDEYDVLLNDFAITSECEERDILAIEKEYSTMLPIDYRSFLLTKGSGEGFVGQQYVILWGAKDIVSYNHEYEVQEYAPGLLLFGSSGGGEGFAFDLRKQCTDIVMVPFVGMDIEQARKISSTFKGFLKKLKEANDELL